MTISASRRDRRRRFLRGLTAAASTVVGNVPAVMVAAEPRGQELRADIAIIGGELGGCAAALAALRLGLRVVMTESSAWIGGQLTAQGVPPDEHRWIEKRGAPRSYRALRTRIRGCYREARRP